MNIEDVIAKYVDLRDRAKELSKKQSEEMKVFTDPMTHIENWLLHQMNTVGCDSFKTGAGTAFRATARSVQLQDQVAFKDFIFGPAAAGIEKYLESSGVTLTPDDLTHIANIIRDLPRWDMVDFRAGKKGITDYQENEQHPVPGVAINTITTVNIRRAS